MSIARMHPNMKLIIPEVPSLQRPKCSKCHELIVVDFVDDDMTATSTWVTHAAKEVSGTPYRVANDLSGTVCIREAGEPRVDSSTK